MKMKRRDSRESSFALLFEWSFKEQDTLDEMIEQATDARDLEVDRFSRELAGKAIDNVAKIDEAIESYSQNWKLSRLSKVTLAALRLSMCELMYFSDIPPGVTINEAVELVKKYGTEDEAAFLNGVLGSYARSGGADEIPATGAEG